MSDKLKLNKGTINAKRPKAIKPRDVLPFPTAMARQGSLVAGTVDRKASQGHDFQPRFPGKDLADDNETVSSDQLIKSIEETLESMQRRLNRVKRDVEHSLKFPSQNPNNDDHRPFAA